IEKATRLAINDHSCVNAATQFAGLAALTGPQDAVHDMLAQFDQRRARIVGLLNALPGVSCTDAAGAFYAFPNITGTGMTSAQAQDLILEKAGVASISGTAFGASGEGYLRFSYANSLDNIDEAMRRIGDLLGR
ncbi:MAG: aminotransferase class I/II-fold pyridoxal phosphate-dependent enzyme, partial [Litorivicinus sp.]